jgi:hypothetical protein
VEGSPSWDPPGHGIFGLSDVEVGTSRAFVFTILGALSGLLSAYLFRETWAEAGVTYRQALMISFVGGGIAGGIVQKGAE